MKTLIETASGRVLAHSNAEPDFTQDPRYDASTHSVITHNEEHVIPFNPAHDDTYHVWNGADFVVTNVTAEEKSHVHEVSEDDFQALLKEHLVAGTGITITQESDGKVKVSLT